MELKKKVNKQDIDEFAYIAKRLSASFVNFHKKQVTVKYRIITPTHRITTDSDNKMQLATCL